MKNERNEWLQCIRSFRFHSIFVKNLLLIFCAIIIPFICVLVISVYAYGNVQKSEEKVYSDTYTARVVADTNNLFKEIREKAIMISIHQDVQRFFLSNSIDQDEFYDLHNIFDHLSLYNVTNEVIDSVYLYAAKSQVVISASGRYAYDDFYDKACIEQWESDGSMYQLECVNRKIIGKNKKHLSFYYTGLNGEDEKAVVIININLEKLHNQLDYGEDIQIAIADEKEILFGSNMEWIGREPNFGVIWEDTGKTILVHEKLKQNDMDIVLQIRSKALYERLTQIKTFIVFFIFVMILLAIFVVVYISKKIYDPISELLDALKREDSLEMENQILQSKDEINYIKNAIYATDAKNKDIEKLLLERLALLKKAQAIALQAQINPHFIHNTLETINWMAIGYLGGENDISEMIDNLSQLLRFSLEDTSTMVTVKAEADYVEKYLYIQQKRFRDKFVVIWKISDELLKCKMIKMAFQPVFENAITYGIKPHEGKGEIRVDAFRDEGDIYIRIWNSGKGLTPDKVDEINESMKKNIIKESDHLGLSNVNQRIRLTFGEEYGVSISSVIREGTTVTLKVPFQL